MADNISVSQGVGTSVRADELAGAVYVQVVKIGLGADGAEDLLLDSGQQAMAASLPVTIASNQSRVPGDANLQMGDVDVGSTNPVPVVSPPISVATACSGLITVATAGTAVQGPNVTNLGGFWVKAHPNNTDTVWVGNDGAGDVANTNGFPLNPGEAILISVTNLNSLWFDADVSGEKLCWHRA